MAWIKDLDTKIMITDYFFIMRAHAHTHTQITLKGNTPVNSKLTSHYKNSEKAELIYNLLYIYIYYICIYICMYIYTHTYISYGVNCFV